MADARTTKSIARPSGYLCWQPPVAWHTDRHRPDAVQVLFVPVETSARIAKTRDWPRLTVAKQLAEGACSRAALGQTSSCGEPTQAARFRQLGNPGVSRLSGQWWKIVARDYAEAAPAPHAMTPTISNVTAEEARSFEWRITGSVQATDTIYNVSIDAYPILDNGIAADRLFDTHLETLATGTTWQFQTLTFAGTAPVEQLVFVDFLSGPSPSFRRIGGPSAMEATEQLRRTLALGARERRARRQP